MRRREEIEAEVGFLDDPEDTLPKATLEVLLDIRDLLLPKEAKEVMLNIHPAKPHRFSSIDDKQL